MRKLSRAFEVSKKDPKWIRDRAKMMSNKVFEEFEDKRNNDGEYREATDAESKTIEDIFVSALYTAQYHAESLSYDKVQTILDMAEFQCNRSLNGTNMPTIQGLRTVYKPLMDTFDELKQEAVKKREALGYKFCNILDIENSDAVEEIQKVIHETYEEAGSDRFTAAIVDNMNIVRARAYAIDYAHIKVYGDNFDDFKVGVYCQEVFRAIATPEFDRDSAQREHIALLEKYGMGSEGPVQKEGKEGFNVFNDDEVVDLTYEGTPRKRERVLLPEFRSDDDNDNDDEVIDLSDVPASGRSR